MKPIYFEESVIRQAKERLSLSGTSIREWADTHGFHHVLVRDVLTGNRAAIHGKSHNIAVLLGMKPGTLNPLHLPEKLKHLLESHAA